MGEERHRAGPRRQRGRRQIGSHGRHGTTAHSAPNTREAWPLVPKAARPPNPRVVSPPAPVAPWLAAVEPVWPAAPMARWAPAPRPSPDGAAPIIGPPPPSAPRASMSVRESPLTPVSDRHGTPNTPGWFAAGWAANTVWRGHLGGLCHLL